MERIISSAGASVAYDICGNGPPLVLVHGSFSDHESNWRYVRPLLEEQFCLYAIARRGRGETDVTEGHSIEDESRDAAAVVDAVGGPVFLLGHSYGALVALGAAAILPHRVRKLILYEPAHPRIVSKETVARLEERAEAHDWDGLATTFFHNVLRIPVEELNELRDTPFWPPTVADAKPSLGDARALHRYDFDADRFRELQFPVMLQVGTESRRDLYVTDALAAVLPDVRVEELPGQAHEGMTTAPELYAASVSRFLLG